MREINVRYSETHDDGGSEEHEVNIQTSGSYPRQELMWKADAILTDILNHNGGS